MKDIRKYSVIGIFFKYAPGKVFIDEHKIGSVSLPENIKIEEMPREISINGFTYQLE